MIKDSSITVDEKGNPEADPDYLKYEEFQLTVLKAKSAALDFLVGVFSEAKPATGEALEAASIVLRAEG